MRRTTLLSVLVLISMVLLALAASAAAQQADTSRVPLPEIPVQQEIAAPSPVQVETPAQPQSLAGAWSYGPAFPFWAGDGIGRISAYYWPETEKVYVLGGRLEDNSTTGMVIAFDPASEVFADTGADMITPVSNYYLSRLNIDGADRICLSMGRNSAGANITSVQCYNPADGTTTEYADASFTGAVRAVGGQAAIGNKLYIFGGFDGAVMFNETWVFDPSQPAGSRWSNLGCPLSSARSYMAAAVIGTEIYAIGGDTFEGGGLVPQTVTQVLDTANLAACWQDAAVADLPAGSAAGDWPGVYVDGAYSLSGYIYTTGGYWPTPGPYDYFFQYDPIGDTWDVNLPALNTTRRNHAMVFVPPLGGHAPRLWVFGGYDGSGTNAMTDTSEYFEVLPVSLSPAEQVTDGSPCTWVSSTLTLANNIGVEDTFDVTYSGNTWGVRGPDMVGPIPDGGSLDFTVGVSVPCSAGCFEEDMVLVEVEAQSNPVYTDSATITTRSGGSWVEEPNAGSQGGYYMMGTCTDDYGSAGTCFYFGGRDYTPPTGAPTSYSQKYDIDTQTWTQIADMPTARYGGLAGWIDGKVYVVGGDTDPNVYAPTDALEVYDPATNTWDTTKAPLPVALTGMMGAVIADKLYVAGGTDGVYVYATLYEYDPGADTWTQLANMPNFFPYYGRGAAVDGRLYVGGSIGGDTTFMAYDPINDQWTQKANIPNAAGQFIPVAQGAAGHIFWWGGTVSDFAAPMLTSTWVYDPVLNVWSQSAAMLNHATAGHAGGWANGHLWSFAGPFQNPHESALPCIPPPPPLGSVEGYTYDANLDTGIYGTYIYIEKVTDPDTYYETSSDLDGYYAFTGIYTGTYKFGEVAAIGYDPIFTGTVSVNEGEVTVQNFWLNASMIDVTPDSLSETVPVDGQAQAAITLSNPGTADLLYHVEEISPDSPFPVTKAAGQPPMPQRVDPQIYQEMAASPDGTTKFLIVMKEQADLSAAYGIADWAARGQYVYNTLQATAERSQAGMRKELAAQGVSYKPVLVNNGLWVEANNKVLDSVLARNDVAYVLANRQMETLPMQETVAAPDAVGWNLELAKADQVWAAGYHGEGIVVANIDSGVWYTHDALREQYRGNLGGSTYDHDYNWFHPTSPAGCDGSVHPCDNSGHGTSTMGIMVGDDGGTNQVGMAPGAKWIACKGCESNSCSSEALLSCADWMLAPTKLDGTDPDPAKRPNIINNSWGGSSEDGWYFSAVAAWRASGMFPAFANGNGGPSCSTAHSPGDYYNSFSSGAIYHAGPEVDEIASYSSRGPTVHYGLLKPNVAAPADPVRTATTGADNAYTNSFNGTSSASPHTAGEVALIWSAQPELIGQIEETEWLIMNTAAPVTTTQGCGGDGPTDVPNNVWGWGIINAADAVTQALETSWDVSWLSVDPMGGSVAPDGTGDLTVTFDATGLAGSMCYTATLKIETNSPYASEWPTESLDVLVPVELCVEAAPVHYVYLPIVVKNY